MCTLKCNPLVEENDYVQLNIDSTSPVPRITANLPLPRQPPETRPHVDQRKLDPFGLLHSNHPGPTFYARTAAVTSTVTPADSVYDVIGSCHEQRDSTNNKASGVDAVKFTKTRRTTRKAIKVDTTFFYLFLLDLLKTVCDLLNSSVFVLLSLLLAFHKALLC